MSRHRRWSVAAPQLAALPDKVPGPPTVLPAQAEATPRCCSSPAVAVLQHADDGRPQLQPPSQEHAKKAAVHAPAGSHDRLLDDEHSGAVVLKAAAAVPPTSAATQQQPATAACNADEQSRPPSPPAKAAAARHKLVAPTSCAWPQMRILYFGASSPCSAPCRSWWKGPVALTARGRKRKLLPFTPALLGQLTKSACHQLDSSSSNPYDGADVGGRPANKASHSALARQCGGNDAQPASQQCQTLLFGY